MSPVDGPPECASPLPSREHAPAVCRASPSEPSGRSLDELIALWLTVLAGCAYVGLVRRTRDVFHPLALFLAGWIGVFAFAHLDVPRTYDEPYYALPFGFLTYVVVFSGGLSFLTGFLLVDPSLAPLEREATWGRLRDSIRLDRLGWATWGLFAIATATTMYFIWRVGEVPLLSPRINELRRIFKVPFLGYLFDLHHAVALFSAMLAVWSKDRSKRLFWTAIGATSTLLLMSGGVRVSPLTALAWVFVFLGLRPGRIRVRQALVAVAVFVVVFGVIEQYRRTQYRLDPNQVNPRLDLSIAATVWGHSAASYKNLQLTVEQVTSPLHMGITSYDLPRTFNPAAREVDQELSTLYGTHNTPTFLGFLYFDFGWGGLLIFPALYGAATAFVYRKFRNDPRIFWLIVHLDFVLAAALAFRTHRFFGNRLIFFAGVAFAVEMIVGRRTLKSGSSDSAVDVNHASTTLATSSAEP